MCILRPTYGSVYYTYALHYARTKILGSSSKHTTSYTFTEDSYKIVKDVVLLIDDKIQH